MEIKIFGRTLFSIKTGKAEMAWAQAMSMPTDISSKVESKFLPDFTKIAAGNDWGSNFVTISEAVAISNPTLVNDLNLTMNGKKPKKAEKSEVKVATKVEHTPKEVYQLKMLHDQHFVLKTDPIYIEGQLADFKDKLGLIKAEEYDMRRGVEEISSIITRLENRKKYSEVESLFAEFPYTTSSRIDQLIADQSHLRLGQVAQFLADMPKEATDAMKTYNKATAQLCGKQAVFYIIANKKDFEKTNKRRDPILLAQSPFGHFWQILGAWDEEMLFLESL